jgi:dTDP-4-amino-4,6-dideoxygalactose transaminase
MAKKDLSRRQFLAAAAATAAAPAHSRSEALVPALLGGTPVRTRPFPAWPVWGEADEKAVVPVLRSGVWSRSRLVTEAEKKFARLMGTEYCLLTTNGTSALVTALHALGVGAGDEVITTPYTFVATIHAVLLNNALPVFADVDPDTWQIDARKIAAKVTKRSAAILPVHIIGGVCDMDGVNAVARKHGLKVVEDACEAHLAEWKHRKVGTLGDLGCFSLQNGKALTCGEGGAIVGNDERTMDLCYAFHNLGRPHGKSMPHDRGGHPVLGSKCRMAEYQASILMTQMERVEEQMRRRNENADYLSARLAEIPGIVPRREHPDATRTSYYYYGFRYKRERFDGLPRDRFLAALGAEGIPASKGLGVIEGNPMPREGVLESTFASKTFRRIYPGLGIERYREENSCLECDRLCEETVGFHQRLLLGARSDMDDIYSAVLKIHENRQKLL